MKLQKIYKIQNKSLNNFGSLRNAKSMGGWMDGIHGVFAQQCTVLVNRYIF